MAIQLHYTGMIDARGRLIVPPRVKLIMQQHSWGRDIFITSTSGEEVLVYPVPLWEDLEKKLRALAAKNLFAKKYLLRFDLWGRSLCMDKLGRIPIPSDLLESAALKGRVALVGDPRFRIMILNQRQFKEFRSSPWYGRKFFDTNQAGIVERSRGGPASGGP